MGSLEQLINQLIIIIGVFWSGRLRSQFPTIAPFIYNDVSTQSYKFIPCSHRSPGGREGHVTQWRRELNPQHADRRRRDQRPRPLGHLAPVLGASWGPRSRANGAPWSKQGLQIKRQWAHRARGSKARVNVAPSGTIAHGACWNPTSKASWPLEQARFLNQESMRPLWKILGHLELTGAQIKSQWAPRARQSP